MRKNRFAIIFILIFVVLSNLLSACSASSAFYERWKLKIPDSCFHGRECCVRIGFDIISVMECPNVSDSAIAPYSFAPINKEAIDAFHEIKSTLETCYEREQTLGKTAIENIELLVDIEANLESITYYMVEKDEYTYCLLLLDSFRDTLYICESY